MKRIRTTQLVPGMRLAEDIFLPNTTVTLIAAGTELSIEMIRRIKSLGIESVGIDETKGDSKDETERRLIPILARNHERMITAVEKLIISSAEQPLEEEAVRSLAGDLLSQVEMDSSLLLNLTHIKAYDNYLFSHSVNVAILTLLVGEVLGYSKKELHELGTAALLHDLGMLSVPQEIWQKQGALSPAEQVEIRKHPVYGEELLRASGFSEEVIRVAREHHERYDGSGYPDGKREKEISFKARILAVTDVYDACISFRPYRDQMTPQQALDQLLSEKEKYDPVVLNAFISVMAIYPIGSFVVLNSGEVAKVIRVSKNSPFRPEVRIYFDREGNLLDQPPRINLAEEKNHTLYIDKTLPAEEHKRLAAVIDGAGPGLP
ncbi:MAG: HD-GYP domain-containing protein [Firmicutes bacterium]|nr:HD-GYP domain-containing protein [Bacillota bacterium]